jgi:hypothetical protein
VDSLDKFLDFHIEKLIVGQDIPVDILKVAARIGAIVEEREMIPEAAMDTEGGHFHIYLQSNFKDRPGAALRTRFSLAHEIAHTLFYEHQGAELKSRKDAPKGDRLEAACHRAAAMILVPSKVLRSEIRQQEVSNSAAVVGLANRFDVSTEVMLRRLSEFGEFQNDWAPVLTRRNGEIFEIEYAVYPPWLKSHLGKPLVGADLSTWFRPTERSDGTLRRKLPDGELEARPFPINGSKAIFELRVRRYGLQDGKAN